MNAVAAGNTSASAGDESHSPSGTAKPKWTTPNSYTILCAWFKLPNICMFNQSVPDNRLPKVSFPWTTRISPYMVLIQQF